jgi:hypothetical protein
VFGGRNPRSSWPFMANSAFGCMIFDSLPRALGCWWEVSPARNSHCNTRRAGVKFLPLLRLRFPRIDKIDIAGVVEALG